MFYVNKTHSSDINYKIARRAHGPLRAHSCRARVPDCVLFILQDNRPPESNKSPTREQKKTSQVCGKKYHFFRCQNHMEQNVLTKRNRFGFRSNLFGNQAVKLARPNASQPNQTWANKGRRAGDERPTSRRISSHILRNDFLWLGHRS